jgi:hypothetical protein
VLVALGAAAVVAAAQRTDGTHACNEGQEKHSRSGCCGRSTANRWHACLQESLQG